MGVSPRLVIWEWEKHVAEEQYYDASGLKSEQREAAQAVVQMNESHEQPMVQAGTGQIPVKLKFNGLSYDKVVGEEALKNLFVDTICTELARRAHVAKKSLAVSLSKGSVVVEVDVRTEDLECATNTRQNLAGDVDELQDAIAEAIRNTPGIEAATVGPIQVSGLNIGEVSEVTPVPERGRLSVTEEHMRELADYQLPDGRDERLAALKHQMEQIAESIQEQEEELKKEFESADAYAEMVEDEVPFHALVQPALLGNFFEGGHKAFVPLKNLIRANDELADFMDMLIRREFSISGAWRKIFDPLWTGVMTRTQFCRGCRQIGHHSSLRKIYDLLDIDSSGSISLTEFAVDEAEVLSMFSARLRRKYGSIRAAADALGFVMPRRVHRDAFCQRVVTAKLATAEGAENIFVMLATCPTMANFSLHLAAVDGQSFLWLEAISHTLPQSVSGRIAPGMLGDDGMLVVGREVEEDLEDGLVSTAPLPPDEDTIRRAQQAAAAVMDMRAASRHQRLELRDMDVCLMGTKYEDFLKWITSDRRFHRYDIQDTLYLEHKELENAFIDFYLECTTQCKLEKAVPCGHPSGDAVFDKLYDKAVEWHGRRQNRISNNSRKLARQSGHGKDIDPIQASDRLYNCYKINAKRRQQEVAQTWKEREEQWAITTGKDKTSDPEVFARLRGETTMFRKNKRNEAVARDERQTFARRMHIWDLLEMPDLRKACEDYGITCEGAGRGKMLDALALVTFQQGLPVNNAAVPTSDRLQQMSEARPRQNRRNHLSHEDQSMLEMRDEIWRFYNLEEGDTVKALRSFVSGDRTIYRVGDIGVVTGTFERDDVLRYRIAWEATGKVTSVALRLWFGWFEIIKKSADRETRNISPDCLERLHNPPHSQWRKARSGQSDSGESTSTESKPANSHAFFRLHMDACERERKLEEARMHLAHDQQAKYDAASVHRCHATCSDAVFERLYQNKGKHRGATPTRNGPHSQSSTVTKLSSLKGGLPGTELLSKNSESITTDLPHSITLLSQQSSNAYKAGRRKGKVHRHGPEEGEGEDKMDTVIDIMRLADGFVRNNQLSRTELRACLHGTKHQDFAQWLLKDGGRNFFEFDLDRSGELSCQELANSIREFEQSKSTLVSSARRQGKLKGKVEGKGRFDDTSAV